MTRWELPCVLQWKEHCPKGQETQVLVPAMPQTGSDRPSSSSKSLPWARFLIRKIGNLIPASEAFGDVGGIL